MGWATLGIRLRIQKGMFVAGFKKKYSKNYFEIGNHLSPWTGYFPLGIIFFKSSKHTKVNLIF